MIKGLLCCLCWGFPTLVVAEIRIKDLVEFDGVRTIEARLMDEACRGIDGPRGPYGDEEIALRQGGIDAIQPEGHLAKPDHMGAHRLGKLAAGAELVLMEIAAPFDHLARLGTAGLEQLPVHVDEVLAARTLVQVVDILGHQGDSAGQQAL